MNRAVQLTSTPYVLVTTPDVIVEPGSTKALLAVLDESPDVGLVAPRVDTPDGELYPSVRRFPNLVDATGAGDSFAGAFLARYLTGTSAVDAARFATSISAWVIEHPGARPIGDARLSRVIESAD